MRTLIHALFWAALLVGCSSVPLVIDGHGIGPAIPCPEDWCDDAVAAVEVAVDGTISNVSWHEEVFVDRDGRSILGNVSGFQQPVGLAVVTLNDGHAVAISIACGPDDCQAIDRCVRDPTGLECD